MKRFKVTYIDFVHENSETEAIETSARDITEDMFIEFATAEEVPEDED
jgi:hypothetical protein